MAALSASGRAFVLGPFPRGCSICCIPDSPQNSSPIGLHSKLPVGTRALRGDLGENLVPSRTFISSPSTFSHYKYTV